MKKFAILLTIFSLIACVGCVFCACDEDVAPQTETVTITVYDSYWFEEPQKAIEIEQEKGKEFSWKEYFEKIDDGEDGFVPHLAFYRDAEFAQKYNENTPIDSDTALYVVRFNIGSACKIVRFNFEGKNYDYFYGDDNECQKQLTLDSFVKSAYGKEIDRNNLEFFTDKEMTNKIDIVGKTFDEIDVEIEKELAFDVKQIYVKLSK